VPDLFVASGARLWDQPKKYPYTTGWQPDYLIEGKILGAYVKEKFAGKKIGYLYQNDDFGQDGVKGLDSQLSGANVVSKQPYETSQPGTQTVCFDIDGVGRFGLAICHDGAFPEIFRSLAWQGAEAIFQLVLTETEPLRILGMIVLPDSSDPGLPRFRPIPTPRSLRKASRARTSMRRPHWST